MGRQMRLTVYVHPRSGREEVRQADGRLEVWTRAPAVDGRANEAVCRLVAGALKVPLSAVQIVHGARARTKLLEVTG